MKLTMECEQEVDGRWIEEAPELPGVLSYGQTAQEALSQARELAIQILSDHHRRERSIS